jgi:hypothetical protein
VSLVRCVHVTAPSLIELNRKLLANLWARGAILQCCFNQSSIDCLCPIYLGSVDENAVFDPELLSGAVFQIKYKAEADTTAETNMGPIGIPRDLERPLPYLAMLMEFGSEASHQTAGSKIKCTPSNVPPEQFHQLRKDWLDALSRLGNYQKTLNRTKAKTKELYKDVKAKQQAMDSCNRYSVAVRGASSDVYGILNEASIVQEFTTLLPITSSSSAQDKALQHMRPLERLGNSSSYTHWMRDYVVSSENSK